MTINTSGITPVGPAILVLPEQVSQTTESGIVVSTDTEHKREQMAATDGIVVAIGPLAFDEDLINGEIIPRCKVGDRIVMTAYAGMLRKGNDNLDYRIIRDVEVIGVLQEKEAE